MPKANKNLKSSPDAQDKSSGNYISKAGLVLTAINILVTATVGIYLAIRNEVLQKRIIEWQKQAELGLIEIAPEGLLEASDPKTWEYNNIAITNKGLGTARNLQVVFCLSEIRAIWVQEINDIDKFFINPNNVALQSIQENIKIVCTSNSPTINNNATRFSLQALPPNQTISFKITLSDIVEVTEVTDNIRVYAIVPSDSIAKDGGSIKIKANISEALNRYLRNKYYAAALWTNVYCDNCAIEDVAFQTHPVYTVERSNIRNLKLDSEDGSFSRISFDLEVLHTIPKNNTNYIGESVLYLHYLPLTNGQSDWPPIFGELHKADYDVLNN